MPAPADDPRVLDRAVGTVECEPLPHLGHRAALRAGRRVHHARCPPSVVQQSLRTALLLMKRSTAPQEWPARPADTPATVTARSHGRSQQAAVRRSVGWASGQGLIGAANRPFTDLFMAVVGRWRSRRVHDANGVEPRTARVRRTDAARSRPARRDAPGCRAAGRGGSSRRPRGARGRRRGTDRRAARSDGRQRWRVSSGAKPMLGEQHAHLPRRILEGESPSFRGLGRSCSAQANPACSARAARSAAVSDRCAASRPASLW